MADQPKCVVYCRSWCGDCHRALSWLDSHGYTYELIDIDEDHEARQRCVELAGKVITPTFVIDDDICMVNFEPGHLAELLGPPQGR